MSYDELRKVNRVIRAYLMDGKRIEVPLDLRVYFPQELDSLLDAAGFEIEHKFGDFDESLLSASSLKQVVCLRSRS